MPRPVHAQGRPGTAVIPGDWEASHAPVAGKTMTATIALRHPGGTTTFDTATDQDVTVPLTPYATDVQARVQAQTSAALRSDIDAAEETVHVAGYLVTLPYCAAPDAQVNDLVKVTASNDPLLTGRTLRVIDVVRGSLRFERDLLCTLND